MPGTRFSRSDKGIVSLAKALMQDILGLSEDTAQHLFRVIRGQGEYQSMKQSIRSMNAVAHRRLNDAINLHAHYDAEIEHQMRPEAEVTKTEKRWHPEMAQDEEFKEMESFVGYLLNELNYDADEIRDPKNRQDIMRLMRANDAQAQQIEKRAETKDTRSARQEIAAEEDPRRATLLRKKAALQKQLEQVDNQLQQLETAPQ